MCVYKVLWVDSVGVCACVQKRAYYNAWSIALRVNDRVMFQFQSIKMKEPGHYEGRKLINSSRLSVVK